MAGALFSFAFKPVMVIDLSLSKDDCEKAGFFKPSAIKPNALSKYLVNALTAPPLAYMLTSAPIISTASSNFSFDKVVVPSPSICPIKFTTPAFLPSYIGPASMFKEAFTFGNLWFSTTSTVMPFGSVKITGSFKETIGAGPAAGFFDLSTFTCADACCNKTTLNATIIIFFI